MKDPAKKPNVRVIGPSGKPQTTRQIPTGRSTRTQSRYRDPQEHAQEIRPFLLRKPALIVISLSILLFVTALVIHFSRQRTSETPSLSPPGLTHSEELIPPADPADWKGALPAEIAAAFTEAKTHTERLQLIADPEANGEIMAAFFSKFPTANERVSALNPMGTATTNKHTFDRYHVVLEDGSSRLLCVRITEDGAHVDFPSYARHCSESWENLLSGKATSADEVRVFIERGNAYLHGYSDDQQWASYIATSPDLEMPLYFYTPRDSEIDGKLSGITPGGRMRATLAIRTTGEASRHRQFEVTDIHATGWVK